MILDLSQKLKTTAVLQPLTPLEALRLLALPLQDPQVSPAMPAARVSLFLSGAVFCGYVAGIRDEAEISYIMLLEHDEAGRGPGVNIIYLPIWAVVAVKVHDADQFLPQLSRGKIQAQQATPGIAELRRKISDELVKLRTVLQTDIKLEVSWQTLSQDGLSLLGLYELIDEFMKVTHQCIQDEFKRIAFKSIIGTIRFQNAQDPEIILDDQLLTIRADLKLLEKGRFTLVELADALETVLEA
ncbi:MAG: hypothetical protein K2X27_24640 [Candidatus Obscuribacterales bacterium]|nr:hypothetical protein [Candidatus Obscuribacterales bacterium]